MTLRIFLCHASEDKDRVLEIYRDLTRGGFRPWLDSEDLIGGQDWDLEIQKAVQSTDLVLVCMSHNSLTKTGYVQKEIKTALDAAERHPEGQLYIVPVRLCPCIIPERLKKWHAVDLYEPGGMRRLERCLFTRSMTGAVWRSSDDDPGDTDRDMANFEQIRATYASAQPPTSDEVIEELEHAVSQIQNAPDFSSCIYLCAASRTAWLHVAQLAEIAHADTRGIAERVDKLIQKGLPALALLRDKTAERYAISIRERARLVEGLRRAFPVAKASRDGEESFPKKKSPKQTIRKPLPRQRKGRASDRGH